ncbi:MAG TPA: NADP-dependent phosphogluconate dehydrogenase [Candidatus Acidoferrum sp.]|nr:NADP-dependent phosphogluconate dehydrogenase [Candidatus Acidoferrum sp.]
MSNRDYQLGVIGLGVMGCNLLLNMADHGLRVAGYDKDPAKVRSTRDQAEGKTILAAESLKSFVEALDKPHIILLLVPAGPPVDAVLKELMPYLRRNDIVIDGGNSHFSDTRLRQMTLAEDGIYLLGVGISGGAEGARHGPSIMPGGAREAYEQVRPIFEAIAARASGEPCVTYCGPGPAGHYVKMVHNGIEYGLMRLIAESYSLMKRGLGLSEDELHAVFEEWNRAEFGGFLLEITANIFLEVDVKTGRRLIDLIRPVARQKGTGMWTSQDAMELQVPVPTIDAAVAMRDLSVFESDRIAASQILKGPSARADSARSEVLSRLRNALHAGMLLTYAQGMALLRTASEHYRYELDLEKVARIWRGGCIIRCRLLDKISVAYNSRPELTNLVLAVSFAKKLSDLQADLRSTVEFLIKLGIPGPAFTASLAYYDTYRTARMASNLIQAQRDYFGAHTYERIDAKGVFHTEWKAG